MEQEINNRMRKTKNLSALALTAAAALAFSGCGNQDQVIRSETLAESPTTNGVVSNSVVKVQQSEPHNGFTWFWWYMIGRNSGNSYHSTSPGISGGSPETYHSVSPPKYSAPPTHSAPNVSRGGFGSIGRGASGGIGS